jgi:phospholipase C
MENRSFDHVLGYLQSKPGHAALNKEDLDRNSGDNYEIR